MKPYLYLSLSRALHSSRHSRASVFTRGCRSLFSYILPLEILKMRRSASRKTGQPNSTSSVNYSPADFFRSGIRSLSESFLLARLCFVEPPFLFLYFVLLEFSLIFFILFTDQKKFNLLYWGVGQLFFSF